MVGARVCGGGPDVLNPAVDVVSEGEPDGLDVVLDGDVKHLLSAVLVLVEEPADEAVPDGEGLVPSVREAVPDEGEVLSESLRGAKTCKRAAALRRRAGLEMARAHLHLRNRSLRLGSLRPRCGIMSGWYGPGRYI